MFVTNNYLLNIFFKKIVMYISQLIIKNYRTFNDFKINLKPLTLIIGENNIGKSNLLDSIGLIFGQDISYNKRRILEVSDFNYKEILRFKTQVLDFTIPITDIKYPKILIEVTLQDWDDDQESVISDWYSNNSFTEATLTYTFAPSSRFNKLDDLKSQRDFIQNFIKENTQEYYDSLDTNAKLDLINFPISKYVYTIYGGGNSASSANIYHLNQLKFELLDALRDARTELVASHNSKLLFRILNSKEDEKYQDLKGQLIGLQQAINENKTLQEIKNGISKQLDKISLATDDTSNLVDLIFTLPDVSDLLKKISLIYGDNPIKIERNGTGRNNLLFISLVLSYVEDITRGHSSYFRIVGLEEPESHLHPNLQDHLAHNIESLIKNDNKTDFRKDIQLLITSHSTHITTKIDFENTVVLYKNGDTITSHYILDGFSNNALGIKQIKYLNKYLDAVNTNIFYSRKIILVEGISEKLLIPIFFERILQCSVEKSSCCVVNVNGLAFSYFLEIIKNGFFQKCLVLTDQDSDTKAHLRANKLAERYNSISQIKVCITNDTTFEKDLIAVNIKGKGRSKLLEVLLEVRPNSGKAYIKKLGKKNIDVSSFFDLIEGYKSEFAYALMLNLNDSDPNTDGFKIPPYIVDGINFLKL